jgi:hypothetical protein
MKNNLKEMQRNLQNVQHTMLKSSLAEPKSQEGESPRFEGEAMNGGKIPEVH